MAFWRPFETNDNITCEESVSIDRNQEFENKDLDVQVQRVILNIHECLKKENCHTSQNEIVKRICELTKLSCSVLRVIKTGDVIDHAMKRKQRNKKIANVHDATKDVIRRTIYGIYQKN